MTRPTVVQVQTAMEAGRLDPSEARHILAAEVRALREELVAAEAKLSTRGIAELVTLFTELRYLADMVMADREPYLEHNARVNLRAWLNEHPAVEPV